MIVPLELTEQDRTDLVAFMETLTGEEDGAAAREGVPDSLVDSAID